MVIDDAVTLMGSYNWTRGAAANSENLNLVSHLRQSRRPTRRTGTTDLLSRYGLSGVRIGAGSPARRCNCPAAEMAMLDTGLRRFVWRIADGLDYVLTLARLRILDALTGPLPETPEDQQRERRRDRLERAFPKIES